MTKWWTIYRYVQQVKPKSEDDPIKWRDPPQNGAQCILRHDSRLELVYVFSQTRLRIETIFIHCKRPSPKKTKWRTVPSLYSKLDAHALESQAQLNSIGS
jgi:hypothetical protein